ncbi:RidA family protein [Candidatus Kapaibacterium sp.]
MKIMENEKIPFANGHYSNIIEHNGILYISGQLPVDSEKNIPITIEEQTLLVLNKIDLMLNNVGSEKGKLLQVRIYITDISYWDIVNDVFSVFMGNHKPTRTIVPVNILHYNCMIEVDAIAYI